MFHKYINHYQKYKKKEKERKINIPSKRSFARYSPTAERAESGFLLQFTSLNARAWSHADSRDRIDSR